MIYSTVFYFLESFYYPRSFHQDYSRSSYCDFSLRFSSIARGLLPGMFAMGYRALQHIYERVTPGSFLKDFLRFLCVLPWNSIKKKSPKGFAIHRKSKISAGAFPRDCFGAPPVCHLDFLLGFLSKFLSYILAVVPTFFQRFLYEFYT